MNFVNNIALVFSGGVIVGSILLSNIGLKRSSLSRRGAASLSGMGVGLGCGIFIFYGISNGDFIGSIIVGMVAALVTSITMYLTHNK